MVQKPTKKVISLGILNFRPQKNQHFKVQIMIENSLFVGAFGSLIGIRK
jgi:hypothetical protein